MCVHTGWVSESRPKATTQARKSYACAPWPAQVVSDAAGRVRGARGGGERLGGVPHDRRGHRLPGEGGLHPHPLGLGHGQAGGGGVGGQASSPELILLRMEVDEAGCLDLQFITGHC